MPEPQRSAPNPFAPPKAEVADVGERQGLALADRGVRLGAALLDGIIFGLIVYLPLIVVLMSTMGASVARFGPGMGPWQLLAASSSALIAGFVGFIAWSWITIVLVSRNGQTIAKRMLGIKVVRKDGSRASLGRIFWLRNFVNALFSMVPALGAVYGLVDALMIFGDSRQCIHDRLADTIVIRA
jgi:uncharacterized RDD family membrane protein YckC